MSMTSETVAADGASHAAASAPSQASDLPDLAHPGLTQHLVRDLLKDRKLERRKTYIKYGIIASLGFAYLGAFLAGALLSSSAERSTEPYAALVKVEGEIMPGKAASAERLNPLLQRAFSDANAKGVILLVNSPGGTPVQSALIRDSVMRLKAKYGKRVIAVGEDVMASGAYMVASAADTILVNRSTVTGSIGVISRSFGFTGLMDKLGVERRVATAGDSKNMQDPFGPVTERDQAKQQVLLERIHAHFIDTVKEGRGDRLNLSTQGLFSGTVWTGEEAVENGLVDSLGDLHAAVDALGAKKVREFATPPSLLNAVMGNMTTQVSQALQPAAAASVPLALLP